MDIIKTDFFIINTNLNLINYVIDYRTYGRIAILFFIILVIKHTYFPFKSKKIVPKSVNYHFTRQCNYSCGFCFHTALTSYVLPIAEAKRGLTMLKNAGNIFISNAFKDN